MSKFLEYAKEEIIKSGDNFFSVAEIIGDGDPEVIELKKNNPCQDIYSVAKAYIVTAIGMCVDRGLLKVTDTVTEALGKDCPEKYHPYWEETTVHNLLLHQIHVTSTLDIDCIDANTFGDDYLNYIMNVECLSKPGGERRYTDGAFYILSRIVAAKVGESTDNFLWKELFYPLGYREAAWSHCPKGHAMGATGLYIRVGDMAKLGAIYLNGGVYKGRRYISEDWVKTVLENGYELRPYGETTAYCKGGMNGQQLLVIPEANRVVSWQSFQDGPSLADLTRKAVEYKD